MRTVIAGGSGLLGRALAQTLRASGHEVTVLTRRPRTMGDVTWNPEEASGVWRETVGAADVVVNLAGEGIADRRWSAARKQALLSSRLMATRALVQAVAASPHPPRVFLSSSAIGIYGDRGDDTLTEASTAGRDFLARLCIDWEMAARPAEQVCRLVLLRTGVVLDAAVGALPQMALPFRVFAGGRIGSGRQFISWIHRDDWTGLVRWALDTADVHGPMNLTAPEPVRNAEFARTLGRVLKRPALLPVPAAALRVAVGEMADAALLVGQRVLPAVAQSHGFRFTYPELEGALRALYEK